MTGNAEPGDFVSPGHTPFRAGTGSPEPSIYQIFVRNCTKEGTFDAAAGELGNIARMGFDWIYLAPVHPIGRVARKGSLGSPYAIRDHRSIPDEYGGEDGFRRFIDAAHRTGLGVMMDVVFNHTAPDSKLALTRPDWFHRDGNLRPAPRIAEWSDVVDLDYSHAELREHQIGTLLHWARFGVDGFRCDVASLVPVDFWLEARARVDRERPLLWLAESVHREFVLSCRRSGVPAAGDPELHRAFDISYDYDGRTILETVWRGDRPAIDYLEYLDIQEALYPAGSVKLRFLENHDQPRAASVFPERARLEAWTVFVMMLPGAFLAYMGQEDALRHRPSLFESDPVDRSAGDSGFREFFSAMHLLSRRMKREAPRFSVHAAGDGILVVERGGADPSARLSAGTVSPEFSGSDRDRDGSGGGDRGGRGDRAPGPSWIAILDLSGRAGRIDLSSPLHGRDAFSGAQVLLEGSLGLSGRPILIERP